MSNDSVERVATGAAWDDFCDLIKVTGHQILDAAPDDPFDRAEGLRYLSRLTRHFLEASIENADPAAVVLNTRTPKIGLDNPDYVYFGARLSSKFEYRLRGQLGDAQRIGFGLYSGGLGTEQGLVRDDAIDSDQLTLDASGRFEIAISQEKRPGPCLTMQPGTNSLQIRQTLLERAQQLPGEMELVRIDAGPGPAPLDPGRFGRALDRVGLMVAGTVGQFLGWTAHFQSHRHEIREIDPALLRFAQGDPNTRYHYSYWELGEGEAFVIDLQPPECEYWNLQIGNHWLESLDYQHHQTHVNHHTAVAEPDGRVRIVVAHRDPGVPNWLDTAGHRRGALALRFVGAREINEPRTRVQPIAELG